MYDSLGWLHWPCETYNQQRLKLPRVSRSHPRIKEKLKGMLKKWAEGEFKTDSALSLIPGLYAR